MIQEFLISLILAVIAFEVIEHVLAPIVWLLIEGRKRSNYSTAGMIGKTVEIKCWDDKSGIVLFYAERWLAVSDKPMRPGEKAIVEEISGLTLIIKPYKNTVENPVCHDRVK